MAGKKAAKKKRAVKNQRPTGADAKSGDQKMSSKSKKVDAAEAGKSAQQHKTDQAESQPAATAEDTGGELNKPSHGRLYGFAKATARFVLHSCVPELLLVTTLVLARYLQNSDFSYPSEVLMPIALLGALGIIFFYVYKLVLRHALPAHLASIALVYGLYGYSYTFPSVHKLADAFTPHSATPFTASMFVFGVLFMAFLAAAGLVDLLVRHVAFLRNLQLHKILVFAVCFMFVVQLGKFGARLWTIRHQLFYASAQQFVPPKPARAAGGKKPNIYYILFDRYADSETLKQLYNYDNTPTLDFLRAQGFIVRDPAYANYPFTTQSVSSTLAMSYFPELGRTFAKDGNFQTAFPYRDILDNPPVAEALQQNGYQYNQLASWWDFTRVGISADNQPTKAFRLRIFGMTFWMSDLQRDIINKSILSPWLKKGLSFGQMAAAKYDRDTAPRDNFEQQISSLKNIAAHSGNGVPMFTFAHILVPHDPYIFSEDGSDPDYTGDRDDNGADELTKYKNQLTYLNTRLEDLVKNVRTHDPNAVVILQADEGPYPKQFRGTLTPAHFYDPINLPVPQMQQKFSILAAYYLPGVDSATASVELTSSVNTFRAVLDNYLGYSLPLLPDCQFTAGNKFQLYNYQLVTDTLKGEPAPPACSQYR